MDHSSPLKERLLFWPLMFLREKLHTVQRKETGKKIEIVKPRVSDVYTVNMGGVDQADQLCLYYYVGRQSRKWYKYLFCFSFNLAACNAYILESESCVKRAQNLFRLELGKRLIGNFNSRERPASDTLPLVSEAPMTHISTKIEGCKRQCLNCKAKGKKTPKSYPIKTKFTCQQCAVALCQEQYFHDYHTEI